MRTSIQQRVMAGNARQRIQSNVMHWAHHIHRTSDGSWSEALQRGWEMHYMRQMLAHGVVEFTFIKRDGTTRTARGTNYTDIIPPSKAPTGHQQEAIDAGLAQPNWKSIAYFDLDKEAWRAFSIERFVQVNRLAVVMPVVCEKQNEKEKANKRKEPKEN